MRATNSRVSAEVEKNLKCKLTPDYKMFLDRYGHIPTLINSNIMMNPQGSFRIFGHSLNQHTSRYGFDVEGDVISITKRYRDKGLSVDMIVIGIAEMKDTLFCLNCKIKKIVMCKISLVQPNTANDSIYSIIDTNFKMFLKGRVSTFLPIVKRQIEDLTKTF